MIRRRLRSPSLKFEMYPIGEKSRTDICLVYLTDTADPRMVEEVKRRLGKLSSWIFCSVRGICVRIWKETALALFIGRYHRATGYPVCENQRG